MQTSFFYIHEKLGFEKKRSHKSPTLHRVLSVSISLSLGG